MSKLKYIVKSILKTLNKSGASVAPIPSDEEISFAIAAAEEEIIALKVSIQNSLTELDGFEGYDEFLDILEDNNKDKLKEFLLESKREDRWKNLKEILLVSQKSRSNEINNDIYNILLEVKSDAIEIKKEYAIRSNSESQDSSYHSSKDSDYVPGLSSKGSESSRNSDEEEMPTKREKAISVPVPALRGAIKTYAKEMMGGVEFTINENIIYVSDKSEIRRPTAVTGNLGSSAGDHVVPFSGFIRSIEAEINGKSVFVAIDRLIHKFGSLTQDGTDYYHPAISSTQKFLETIDRTNIEGQIKAFQFLRSEFIPHLAATWNQKIGTAFKSDKTNAERGQEGAVIRNMLSITSGEVTDEIIDYFVNTVDYKPLNSKSIPEVSAQDMFLKGLRTNHFSTLMHITEDIVEYFISNYENESTNNKDLAEKLIKKLLETNGWIKYFNNKRNKSDLDIDPSIATNIDSLSGYILQDMKEKKPLLFDVDILEEELRHSSSRESTANASEPKVKSKQENIGNTTISGFPIEILSFMSRLSLKNHSISPEPKKANTNKATASMSVTHPKENTTHTSDQSNLFVQGAPIASNFSLSLRSGRKILPKVIEVRAVTSAAHNNQLPTPSTPIVKNKGSKSLKKSWR